METPVPTEETDSDQEETASKKPNPYTLCEKSESRFCVLNPDNIEEFGKMSPSCALFYFTLKQFPIQWKLFRQILKRIESIPGECHQALVEYNLSPEKMDDEEDPPKEGYWILIDGKYKKYTGNYRALDIFRWTVKSAFDIVHTISSVSDLEGFNELKSYALLINTRVNDYLSQDYKRLAREIKDLNFLRTFEPEIAAKFNSTGEAAIILVTNFNGKYEKLPLIDEQLDINAAANFLSDKRRTDVLPLDSTHFDKYMKWRDTNIVRITTSPDKQKFIDFARRFNGIDNPEEKPEHKAELDKLFPEGFIVEGFWPNFMQIASNDNMAGWFKYAAGRNGTVEGEDWIIVLRKEDDEIHKWVITEWTFESLKKAILDIDGGQLARFFLSQEVAAQDDLPVIGLTKQTLEDEVIENRRSALVLVYSPRCGFCVAKREMMKKLAAYYEGTPRFGVYEIDGTENEHPSFYAESYPVLLYYTEPDKMSPEVLKEDADFDQIVKRLAEIGIRSVKSEVGSEL